MKRLIVAFLLLTVCPCFSQVSEKDKKFLKKAAEDNISELMLSKLAATRALRAEVKTSAAKMVEDHTKTGEELRTLAAQKNVPLPAMLNNDRQDKCDAIAKMKSDKFDKKYPKCMVKDHEKAVELFKNEVQEGSDADVKKWASEKIPMLEKHLAMWQEIDKKTKK